MKAIKLISLAIAFICASQAAMAEDCSAPFVKTPDAAGWIAFAALHALNPKFTTTDEKEWFSHFTVSLRDCVWSVSEKPVPPRDYSTFVMSISAKDGRVMGAQVSD